MSEKKDPIIKLFGKMIQIGSNSDGDSSVASIFEPSTDVDRESTDSDQNILCSKQSQNRGDEVFLCLNSETALLGHEMVAEQDEEPSSSSTLEESKTLTIPSSSTTPENPLALSNDKKSLSQDQSQKEEQCDQTSSSQSQDQSPPKKPDKIIPCPRCNSMETKFCYFNNYNVNQPRHFCKNCQRYWTAGGTMRNVPVGAGRRKNKSSSTSQHHHHHHLVIPDRPNALIHHALRPNGTILTFGGQDSSPLSESMASMLKLGEKTPHNCVSNGLMEQGTRVIPPCGCSKNGKQDTNNTTSNDNLICRIEENNNNGNKVTSQSLPPPLVCFTNTSWPYTWNPIPLHSGFPMSFYSPTPPFLPCNPQGTWNLQWLPTPSSIGPDHSSSSISNPNSPLVGKHSRDANEEEQPREEKRSRNSRVGIGIPKTMRIDDPTETAKSSIWGTLGIKNNDKVGLLNVVGGGFFGGFEQLKEGNNQEQGSQISNEGTSSSYLALQANPAAFSRSLSFHENAY